MDIVHIMQELGVERINSFKEIEGGRDSLVFKIETEQGQLYALRILPKNRLQQFKREAQILQFVYHYGIPAPSVHAITCVYNYAVMLMEWVSGCTVFEELTTRPENAKKTGYAFGKTQATIHQIQATKYQFGDWISPDTKEEKDIYEKIIRENSENKRGLLHLDYHPLNVHTDGENITGVFDWVNDSYGDCRLDLARTLSILKVEGVRFINPSTVKEFEQAWRSGYEREGERIHDLGLYYKWAELKMKNE